MKKHLIQTIKYLDGLSSSLSCRLTKLTGKSKHPIHPKHLIQSKLWYENYIKKNDRVLDVGCGVGQSTLRIANKAKCVIGLDYNNFNINIAKETTAAKNIKNIEFINFDANKKLPFKDSFFDKVICSDVLEHLDKRDYAIGEIKRVLKSGGFLFLVTDNPNTSWKKLQKSVGIFYYADSEHRYEYPKDEITEILSRNNFNVTRINTVTYDTPIKGMIDFTGGISLALYKKLKKVRENFNKKYPEETTGFRIIALKK